MAPVDLKPKLELADEASVAALLNMTLPSLRNQRARDAGPPYQRIGRRVFYPLDKLRAFLAASTVTPSSKPTLTSGASKRRRAP